MTECRLLLVFACEKKKCVLAPTSQWWVISARLLSRNFWTSGSSKELLGEQWEFSSDEVRAVAGGVLMVFYFYKVEMLSCWSCRWFLMGSSSLLRWLFLLLFLFALWSAWVVRTFVLKVRNVIKTVWIMDWVIFLLFLTSPFPKFLLLKKVEDG